MAGHSNWNEIEHKRTVHVEAAVVADVDELLDRLPPLLAESGAGDPAVIYDHQRERVSATFQLRTRTREEAVSSGVELVASSIERLYGRRPTIVEAELAART